MAAYRCSVSALFSVLVQPLLTCGAPITGVTVLAHLRRCVEPPPAPRPVKQRGHSDPSAPARSFRVRKKPFWGSRAVRTNPSRSMIPGKSEENRLRLKGPLRRIRKNLHPAGSIFPAPPLFSSLFPWCGVKLGLHSSKNWRKSRASGFGAGLPLVEVSFSRTASHPYQ